MCRFLLFSFLFAGMAAVPIVEQKTFPGWPNSFSMSLAITQGFGTPNSPGEMTIKMWYNGEECNLKEEITQGKNKITAYTLKNYDGKGIEIYSNTAIFGGVCIAKFGRAGLDKAKKNPLPPMENIEFIGESEMKGEKVEQWKTKPEEQSNSFTIVYCKRQNGVAIPVMFELFSAPPTDGGDMILPTVIEVTEFSAAKPDSSTFAVDPSKCIRDTRRRIFTGIDWAF